MKRYRIPLSGGLSREVTFTRDREGLLLHNVMFSPQGTIHVVPRSRLKRWWLRKRGWTLYVGEHFIT